MYDMHDLTRKLQNQNGTKIVLVVADGLGGLPLEPGGNTELETARTPNLDELAQQGTLGLSIPVKPGITPGSGPGHLGLFGYDPLKYQIGRGVLEALGIDFELGPNDVAIRGNFCTLDAKGNISDRRAGRIKTEAAAPLCEKLNRIKIPGVEVFVRHVKEYRMVVVFRGAGLEGDVHDTDPQQTGVPPLAPAARRYHLSACEGAPGSDPARRAPGRLQLSLATALEPRGKRVFEVGRAYTVRRASPRRRHASRARCHWSR